MDEKLQELRDRLVTLHKEASAIPALADDEKRDNTPAELERVEALGVEMTNLRRAIDAREKLAQQGDDLARPRGRRTDPAPLARDDDDRPASLSGGRQNAQPVRLPAEPRDGRLGFRSFGEFALSVRRADPRGGGQLDRRLEQCLAPTTYGSEASGADGGFLVPVDWRNAIMAKVAGEDSLVSRTDQLTTASNRITVPVDETEPWSSSGVRAFWTGEAQQKTQSKPTFRNATVQLDKLAALVVCSDELLEDASALDAYLKRKTPEVFNYKANDALVNGTGAGMPLGILKSPALVSVAKESGQAIGSVIFVNLAKMWGRLYAPCRRNAVWLMNADVEPLLMQTYLATGTANGQPTYLPPGGMSAAPYGTIFGRPIVIVENMKSVGLQGDIVLVDLSQYLTVTKTDNKIKTDVSIHLFFDFDATAYRFVMRIGGHPWWNAAITRANGSNTLSWAVALDDRTS